MMRLHISSGSFDQADCGAKFRMLPWLFAVNSLMPAEVLHPVLWRAGIALRPRQWIEVGTLSMLQLA